MSDEEGEGFSRKKKKLMDEADSSDDDAPSAPARHFGFVKSATRLQNPDGAPADDVGEYIPDAKEEMDHRKRTRPDREFGSFEKHTKGFGMKMLQKFGFKGGLGARDQGISTPITASVRPALAGLGSVREADHHPELEHSATGKNVVLPSKPTPGQLAEMDENDPDLPPIMRRLIREQKREQGPKRWKKPVQGAAPVQKPVYLTAAELIQKSGGVRKETILDMRGPEVRVLDSLREFQSAEEEEYAHITFGGEDKDSAAKRNCPELLNNLQYLVASTESAITATNGRLEAARDQTVTLSHERDRVPRQPLARPHFSGGISAPLPGPGPGSLEARRNQALEQAARIGQVLDIIRQMAARLRTADPLETFRDAPAAPPPAPPPAGPTMIVLDEDDEAAMQPIYSPSPARAAAIQQAAARGGSGSGQPQALTRPNEGPVTDVEVAQAFELLHNVYRSEYEAFQLWRLAESLVIPRLKQYLQARWAEPLSNPTWACPLLDRWRRVLCQGTLDEQKATAEAMASNNPLRPTGAPAALPGSEAMYRALIQAAVLPMVQRVICSQWRIRIRPDAPHLPHCSRQAISRSPSPAFFSSPPSPDPLPLIAFLKTLQPYLGERVLETLGVTLVLPRLQHAVDQWNPAPTPSPSTAGSVLPWLELLPRGVLEPLFGPIRLKLVSVLGSWHPSDPSAHAVLKPWVAVFEPTQWSQTAARYILPPLSYVLQSQLTISPDKQVLEPFKWVMAWADLVPLESMALLLERDFFPKWLTALQTWLGSRPDYGEVTKWYVGWKGLFPKDLAEVSRIRAQFTRALDLMNRMLEV
ncbi:putative Tuftelin-interacting protein 11 [Paratrimastix pyriformis]|uniref:Tuftelin-interacting protein 11 n=1 Tax=Paratrimastix pyriformis TaxID=342808 RepID=A0ABQ8UQ14_9EUKA|nr:putative Tuftelin-interacting protein 11 [Paratrimastix pyriformis]